MKANPISVFAINATVVLDITPKGKDKFIIDLNSSAGDAVDIVQRCHDFRLGNLDTFELIEGENIFKNRDCYITFSILPKSNGSINLITCRCEQPELNQDKAIKLVKKGMELAFSKLNS